MQIICKVDFSEALRSYTKFPMLEILLSEDGNKLIFKERYIAYKFKSNACYIDRDFDELRHETREKWVYLNEYNSGIVENDKENIKILSNFCILNINSEDYAIRNGKVRRLSLTKSFNKIMKKFIKIYETLSDFIKRGYYSGYGILRTAPTNGDVQMCFKFIENWTKEKYPFLKDYFSVYSLYSSHYYFLESSVSKVKRGVKLFEGSKKEIKRIITSKEGSFFNNIEKLRIINYVGIKDINVIAKILKDNERYAYTPMDILKHKPGACRYYLKALKENYHDINCDALLLKRFSNKNSAITLDTMGFLAIYNYIKTKSDVTYFSKKEIAEASIKELHDKLFHVVRDATNLYHNPELKNDMELNELNKKLNGVTIDNYKFIVPVKYSEFLDLGDIMNNCVATYYKAAFHHLTNIVYGIENGKANPDICIEIDNNLEVKQCYGNHNSKLTKEKEEITLKYFKAVGVSKHKFRYDVLPEILPF